MDVCSEHSVIKKAQNILWKQLWSRSWFSIQCVMWKNKLVSSSLTCTFIKQTHTHLVLDALLRRVHRVALTALNALQRLLDLRGERETDQDAARASPEDDFRGEKTTRQHALMEVWR